MCCTFTASDLLLFIIYLLSSQRHRHFISNLIIEIINTYKTVQLNTWRRKCGKVYLWISEMKNWWCIDWTIALFWENVCVWVSVGEKVSDEMISIIMINVVVVGWLVLELRRMYVGLLSPRSHQQLQFTPLHFTSIHSNRFLVIMSHPKKKRDQHGLGRTIIKSKFSRPHAQIENLVSSNKLFLPWFWFFCIVISQLKINNIDQ